MSTSLVLFAAAIAQSSAPPAIPIQAPAPLRPAPKPADNTVSGVVVTGAAAEVQTSIDRRSYSLGKDIAAASGSIADALRNVPSVEVDLQGGLTLRGDPNVTILIDGKPSAAFEGNGRAEALQQLPADQYERVEVITNPSAAMTPEGSGGVINLISKRSSGAGWTGSTYGTAGTAGLKRAGATFGYNSKALNVTGSLSGAYQHNKSVFESLRSTLIASSGLFEDHSVETVQRGLTRGQNGRLTVGYALSPKDQLTAAASYNQSLGNGAIYNRFEDYGPGGGITTYQERLGRRRGTSADSSLSGGWRRTFAPDHQFSVDLVQNQSRSDGDILTTTLRSLPLVALPLERNAQTSDTSHSELKLTYTRPTAGGGKLVAGYELKYDENQYSAGLARGSGVAALTPDPGVSYRFDYRQTLIAAYATYDRTFGDLAVQAGLRVENARLALFEQTTQVRGEPDYFRAYPTLHLNYTLDDESKLRASYTTRVQRPPPFLLNPFRIYIDPRNSQQGNINLRPQNTQSYELSYEKRHQGALYQATAYYRRNEGEFSLVTHDQGGGAVVTTFENLGSSRSAGLELAANGKLSSTLTYGANATLYWTEVNAANLGFADRSVAGVSGRANLNWQVTKDDLVQLNVTGQSKRLYAQGTIDPTWTMNLGYRRKLNDRVTATLSVQDLLKSSRFSNQTDTPAFRERADFRPVSRAVLLRLDYRFGAINPARPVPEPGFDFGASGQAGP